MFTERQVAEHCRNLKQCKHGSFFVLPWRRMYIFYFEKVLRAASGDLNFALPYWRWTSHRAMPLPFRSPSNATNKLFVVSPNRGAGSTLAAYCQQPM
jgi:hypothetical protein